MFFRFAERLDAADWCDGRIASDVFSAWELCGPWGQVGVCFVRLDSPTWWLSFRSFKILYANPKKGVTKDTPKWHLAFDGTPLPAAVPLAAKWDGQIEQVVEQLTS